MSSKRLSGRARAYLRYLRDLAFEAQHGLCWWCETPMVPAGDNFDGSALPKNLCTAEHLIPREFGGSNSPGNVVAACAECNHTKRNYQILELETLP